MQNDANCTKSTVVENHKKSLISFTKISIADAFSIFFFGKKAPTVVKNLHF